MEWGETAAAFGVPRISRFLVEYCYLVKWRKPLSSQRAKIYRAFNNLALTLHIVLRNEGRRFGCYQDRNEGWCAVVTWEPNLNTNGEVRLYKVYGKETLSPAEEWVYPTNSLHRFFKVSVQVS